MPDSSRHPSKMQENPVPRQQLHKPVNGPVHTRSYTNKKQGAGRGGWGKVNEDYGDAPAALDKNDPNYDPSEGSSFYQVSQ